MKQLLPIALTFFIFCFASITYTKTVFIIIHGTWAKQSWYLPGGDFFNAIEKSVHKQKAVVISYRWSGKNNYQDRIKAAEGLVQLIQSYSPEATICLISHSHGGNVGIIASQLLARMTTANKINIFYALGTPVNNKDYQPNMDTINYFYNLFSFEDFLQPVFGFFEREYAQHERIANICITTNNKEPNHTQLHNPLVGQWLPCLHELLTTAYFSTFDFKKPGIVHFADNKNPIYVIDERREQLLERDQLLTKMIVTSFFRSRMSIG